MRKELLIIFSFVCMACNNKEKSDESAVVRSISEKITNELNVRQLIDLNLLQVKNDTIKVCYALVMPKQTLLRLAKEKTYPTAYALKELRELYTNSILEGDSYFQTKYEEQKDDKDWLINNTINEPINAIWEQITEER